MALTDWIYYCKCDLGSVPYKHTTKKNMEYLHSYVKDHTVVPKRNWFQKLLGLNRVAELYDITDWGDSITFKYRWDMGKYYLDRVMYILVITFDIDKPNTIEFGISRGHMVNDNLNIFFDKGMFDMKSLFTFINNSAEYICNHCDNEDKTIRSIMDDYVKTPEFKEFKKNCENR